MENKEKMKILFWMNSPTFGGTEMMNLRLLKGLQKDASLSLAVLFFTRVQDDLSKEFRSVCREVYFCEGKGGLGFFSLLWKYDLIYAFGWKANFLARLFKIFNPRFKLLSGLHAVIPHTAFHSNLPVYLDKLTWRLSDIYVSNSYSHISFLQKNFHYPGRFRVIEHVLDNEEAAKKETSFVLRDRFHLEKDSIVVTYVASFYPVKNQMMLLKALGRLKDDRVHVFLLGKGKGEMVEPLS